MIEIKSAQTINPEAMRPIANILRTVGERNSGATLVYGGNERQRRSKFSDTEMKSKKPSWNVQIAELDKHYRPTSLEALKASIKSQRQWQVDNSPSNRHVRLVPRIRNEDHNSRQ